MAIPKQSSNVRSTSTLSFLWQLDYAHLLKLLKLVLCDSLGLFIVSSHGAWYPLFLSLRLDRFGRGGSCYVNLFCYFCCPYRRIFSIFYFKSFFADHNGGVDMLRLNLVDSEPELYDEMCMISVRPVVVLLPFQIALLLIFCHHGS